MELCRAPKYLGNAVVTWAFLNFVLLVVQVAKRYRRLNLELEKVLASVKLQGLGSAALACRTPAPSEELSLLTDVYQELCGLVGVLESIYGLQNLSVLVYFFAQLVLSPFYCLAAEDLFSPDFKVSWNFGVLQASNALLTYYLLLFFLWPCTYLENSALEARRIITMFLDPIKNPRFSDMEIFNIKVSYGFRGISVMSLFDLNASLAVDVIGAASTYCIIFIQF